MKKRLAISLVLVCLLVAMLPVMPASALIGPQYVSTSNGYGVHLRTAPSVNAEIILTIPFAAQVSSYEYYNNTWGFVSYGGQYGYAMSRYFSSTKPTIKPTPTHTTTPAADGKIFSGFTTVNYYITVKPSTPSGFVNLRWAPSKTEPIITNYRSGYTLRVIAQNSTWAQVYDDATGICGFMMRSFLNQYVDGMGDGAAES